MAMAISGMSIRRTCDRMLIPRQIEGMFTVVVGIIFLALFPRQTSKPVSLLGVRYFNEREAYILTQRILLDDPSKLHAKSHVSWAELRQTVTRPIAVSIKFHAEWIY